ncbi:MAG: hypothetical protein JNG84_01460 [Archangium sp.]|nr:hypothetical protein [Archangium sp.]
MLLHVHSGLRFLVLLSGVGALGFFIAELARKRDYAKPGRIVGAVYSGLLQLQVVVGIVQVAMGVFYPQLIGHMVLMVLAAAVTQMGLSLARRGITKGYLVPTLCVAGSLVLIVAGIFAIGRSPLQMTVGG